MRALGEKCAGALFCLCMSVFAQLPAEAQPQRRTIEVNTGEDWHHQHTGATMPARLGGFDRQYIRDLTENELDVFAQYKEVKARTRLTLFFYRAAVDNIPLWFDVANQSLRNNVDLLPGASEYSSSTFTPPGQFNASGMMAVYATDGGDFKSTGVAMLPLNGWIVKIRFTSAELTVAELASTLVPILNAIPWPEKISSGPPASKILPCKNRLKLVDKVGRIKPSMTDALIGGLMGIPADDEADANADKAKPVIYCRDPQDFGQFSIYRADGTKRGYLMPLGDAGRAISVDRNEIGGLIDGSQGNRYTPVLMQLDRNIVFPDLNKLPEPGTLMAATGDDAAISSVTTWPTSSGSTVTISVSPDEDQ